MYDKLIAIGLLILVHALIASGKIHRTIAAFLGAILLVILGILTELEALNYIEWEVIGLIFGMFVLVETLSESGFFRWIGLHTLKATRCNAMRLFLFFSILSAFLAAFMDSITVLLFMASLTIEICRILRLSPIPLIIAEITSANIGGSATMVGDPPNVIIGTSLNYSFTDFLVNTAPIAIVVFLVNLAFFYFWYRKVLEGRKEDLKKIYEEHKDLDPHSAILDLRLMWIALSIFTFTVTMLVLHHTLNVTVAFVGVSGACLVLLMGGKKMVHVVEKIDWNTILFFACLFVVVGGLEKTGVLSDVASGISIISGGSVLIAVTLILWFSAVLSAWVDNVPLAIAMVPVIKDLAQSSNFPLPTLAWTLALGTDIGGNGTPIGASANIVGLAATERKGIKVTLREYCKVALPAMIISIVICNIMIFLMFLI